MTTRAAHPQVLVSLLCVAIAAAGCGGARAPSTSGNARIPSAAPGLMLSAATAAAPQLTRLPPAATFAWVEPGRHFDGVQPAEDVAQRESLRELRETASTVLRANDWREVPASEAQYHLVMAMTVREAQREYWVPDPRNERQPRPVCTITRDRREVCHTPQAPRYPPTRRTEMFQDRRVGYAIVNVRDGTMKWWILQLEPKDLDRFVARVTVELLLVEDRDPGR